MNKRFQRIEAAMGVQCRLINGFLKRLPIASQHKQTDPIDYAPPQHNGTVPVDHGLAGPPSRQHNGKAPLPVARPPPQHYGTAPDNHEGLPSRPRAPVNNQWNGLATFSPRPPPSYLTHWPLPFAAAAAAAAAAPHQRNVPVTVHHTPPGFQPWMLPVTHPSAQ